MAGALAMLAVLLILAVVSIAYGRAVSVHKADAARATAAQETAEQMAAAGKASGVEAMPVHPPAEGPARAAVAPPRAAEQRGAAFLERFSGRELGERWFVSDGWSNGDWTENDWRASQVSFIPEGLRITLAPSPEGSEKPFAGGEIRTNEYFRYGYFEIRMRAPRDPGLVTGVFTYAGREEGALPNEIDIEIIGRDTRTVELTYHQGGKAVSRKVPLGFDSADGFHTYAFEWRPDAVRWLVDGKVVHQETGGGVPKLMRAQQFMVSQWSSRQLRSWVGDLDASRAPWFLDIACIAYAPSYQGRQLCAG